MTKKLQILIDELLAAKKGIKIYTNPGKSEIEQSYMFVTNGKAVIYIQDNGGLFGLSMCLEYKPDKENGSGCHIVDEEPHTNVVINSKMVLDLLDEFTNDMSLKTLHKYNTFIKPCVQFYKDADEWYDNLYNKEKYVIFK